MTAILRKLEAGDATQGELDLLLDVCDRINGKCLCPLGDTAAIVVASYVASSATSSSAHIDEGGCPFADSSLDHVLAPIAQHAHAPSRRCRVTVRRRPVAADRGRMSTVAQTPRTARRLGSAGCGSPVPITTRRGSRDASPELVTVTIDERQVQVPKGTGMVETAAAAGIEIPVFCYEPRLGPPVGACRMCLVEVGGHAEAPGRLHAHRRRTGWSSRRRAPPSRRPRARTRRSSSSSSTTRSTAPSATRAASARCRT